MEAGLRPERGSVARAGEEASNPEKSNRQRHTMRQFIASKCDDHHPRSLMITSRVQTRVALLVFACVVAVALTPALYAGSPGTEKKDPRTLTLTKDCGSATLAPGELSYCTVTESNFRALRGAKIRYFGPGFRTVDHPFLDSWVVIESEHDSGGTAFG